MLAASGDHLTLILSAVALLTGFLGALNAVVRMPRERDSAAISQAQGANEALAQTLEATERERDYWRDRYFECAHSQRERSAE